MKKKVTTNEPRVMLRDRVATLERQMSELLRMLENRAHMAGMEYEPGEIHPNDCLCDPCVTAYPARMEGLEVEPGPRERVVWKDSQEPVSYDSRGEVRPPLRPAQRSEPTPGPWKVYNNADDDIGVLGICELRSPRGQSSPREWPEDLANANLIAAAPDLLAAAQALIYTDNLQRAIDLARAALAKAEGKS